VALLFANSGLGQLMNLSGLHIPETGDHNDDLLALQEGYKEACPISIELPLSRDYLTYVDLLLTI
jgi:hypothetical protein